jgi:hypothetical protein
MVSFLTPLGESASKPEASEEKKGERISGD